MDGYLTAEILQLFSAVPAIGVALLVHLLATARTTSVLHGLLRFVDDCGCYDACWDGDDGVTEEHDDGRKDFTEERDGSDIAITYGGERDDGPVDAGGEVGELRTRESSFHHEHKCTEAAHEHDDEKEEHKDAVEAFLDGNKQEIALVDELEKLENAEHTEQAQSTELADVACSREKPDNVERNGGKEIHDTEEAEDVAALAWRAPNANDVLHREDEREDVFNDGEYALGCWRDSRERFHLCNQDTQHDDGKQEDIVEFSSSGFKAKNNFIYFFFAG